MQTATFRGLLVMTWGLVLVPPVAAEEEKNLGFRVGYGIQTDSNLFRLPAGADTMALLGTRSASDRIDSTTLGLTLHTRQGLQSFKLDASVVDYRYRKFSHLDFTGTNYELIWLWALTPRLTGNLSSDRKQTLNSYTDYQGYSSRNERLDTRTQFDIAYEIDGPWRLLAGIARTRQSNQQALVAGGDFSSQSAQIGVRRVHASGSTLSFSVIASDGRYLNRTRSSQALLDDRYTQTDNDLRFHGVLGSASQLDAYLSYFDREHPHFPQRDFSGLNAGASLNWALSGKTTLAMSYARELGAYATSYANYSETNRITLSPVWRISVKTELGLRQTWTQVDFRDAPTGGSPNGRQDTGQDTTLFFNWHPREPWTLMASLQRQTRSSSIAGLDYESDMASVSAQYSF
jgi:exopolysaccharide biosynthesis operon protein EpsL